LTLGLAEVFDALNELSLGNPKVRSAETSEIDLIAELKTIVNLTAKNLGEIVDLSHEFAMGLAEHFDVLHRVSKGDLSARVEGTSHVELLESLKDVTNQTIESVFKEISERKRAEETARTSEDKYRHVSRSLTLGLAEVFDALNEISYGNPHVRIPETSELDLIADLKRLVNMTAENLGEIVDLSHEFAMGLAEHFDVLHRVSKGDLSAQVVGTSRVELLESLREITNQMIQSVSREIAERVRAEEALQKAHHDLELRVKERTAELISTNQQLRYEVEERKRAERNVSTSEEKYRLLFNYDPNPLLVVEPESGEILDVNNAAVMTYGYERQELERTSFWALFGADEAPRVRKELGLLMGERYFLIPKLWAMRKDGSRFIVDLHARGAEAEAGDDTLGVPLIVRTVDITRRLEQEANLIQAGKMATLGEMATGIAHELNQPLNVIQVGADFFSKMVSRGRQIPEEQLIKTCRNMRAQVDRATRIINHLREFGRKSDLEYYPVDINQPVKDVFTILGQQLRLRKIEVNTALNQEPLMILADKNRLEQVFLNLVTNARDAMEAKGEGEKTLTIKTFREGALVVASVADTGTGIPRSMQEKIFQPFFTTKEIGRGTGLGLSISYNLVKDFGGEIDVESVEGKGSTFTMRFPAYEKKTASKARGEKPSEPVP
jgi:PAS domain S-box-containing protein